MRKRDITIMIRKVIFQHNKRSYTIKLYFIGILIYKKTKYPVFQE